MQSDGDGAAGEVLRDGSLLELKLWLVPIFCSHQSAHRLLVLGVTADVWELMCRTLVTVLHMWFHHSEINEKCCFERILYKLMRTVLFASILSKLIMMWFINFTHASRMLYASHKISWDYRTKNYPHVCKNYLLNPTKQHKNDPLIK
jgi:hypothetical protein